MRTSDRRLALVLAAGLTAGACQQAIGTIHTPTSVRLPNRPASLRFAVIGDSGEPGAAQTAIADLLTKYRALFRYEFVLMVGDNTYNPSETMTREFEQPYKALLDQHVPFFASLGNHDLNVDVQTRYALFNMNGEQRYAFRKGNAAFFALNSNKADAAQLRWIDQNLQTPESGWKIVFFHHPFYSSGQHSGENPDLKAVWEPRFCAFGVDVVFSGHEHFYERIKPQRGIQHFVTGAASKLRPNDVARHGGPHDFTAAFNDADLSFMLIEISDSELFFQTVTLTGEKLDEGVVRKVPVAERGCDPVTI